MLKHTKQTVDNGSIKKYIKKLIMGKFYEDLDTLNELIKKLDKKNEVSVFMIRVIRYAKENPEKSVSDIIKDIKKGRD
jgi:cobyric acid synthase